MPASDRLSKAHPTTSNDDVAGRIDHFDHVVDNRRFLKRLRSILSNCMTPFVHHIIGYNRLHRRSCKQAFNQLSTELGLGLRDIAFDVDPATRRKKGTPTPPNFWPMSIVAKRLDG